MKKSAAGDVVLAIIGIYLAIVVLIFMAVEYLWQGVKKSMRYLDDALIPLMVTALLLLTGCAQMFTAKTTASYRLHPDGTKEIIYSSDKEQVGLDVDFEEDAKGNIKKIRIRVDKSGTQESVIAASMAIQQQALKLAETAVQGAAKVPVK